MVAPCTACHTGLRSEIGLAVQMLPARVATFRICVPANHSICDRMDCATHCDAASYSSKLCFSSARSVLMVTLAPRVSPCGVEEIAVSSATSLQ